MTQRFLVYPLIMVCLMQLVSLLRGDTRWFAEQLAQLMLILLASLGAMFFSDDFVWVVIAWSLFGVFLVVPKVFSSLAARCESRAQWRRAAPLRRLAGRLTWGRLGQLHCAYADALGHLARGNRNGAEAILESLLALPMPHPVTGAVRIWKLGLLVAWRDWDRAIACYESALDWGNLSLATHARLLAARAYAEAGQTERAVRSLQFVALSPRTLGARQRQLWMTRVIIAALAGDKIEVDNLLRRKEYGRKTRGFGRFASYWRGRCALTRGEQAEAVRQLTRAFSLTHPRDNFWREAIAQQLRRAEAGDLPAVYAAQQETYAHAQEMLRVAEHQAADWRALMQFGQPALITLALLLAFAVVFLVSDLVLTVDAQDQFLLLAGNGSETVRHGEWWRLFTALFLHANLLHLAMNGTALWIFGSAVEKALGRWRFFAVFFITGAVGNFLSALLARYDIAVGASAGIFGVVGAFAVAVYRLEAPMYMAVRRRLIMILALVVAADFIVGGMEPQVDNLAHVGGFLAGIGVAVAVYPRRARTRLQRHRQVSDRPL